MCWPSYLRVAKFLILYVADGVSEFLIWTVSDSMVSGLLLPMIIGAAKTVVPRRAALAAVANFMSAVMDFCGSEVK